MINADFWKVIRTIVAEGFSTKGLQKLDYYAEQFISGRLVYQRFSPLEQHGCAEGGETHVIASLLAGAEIATNPDYQKSFLNFESERQCAAQQESCIEGWARRVGCWIEKVDDSLSQTLGKEIAEGGEAKVYDHGTSFVKSIGLDYYPNQYSRTESRRDKTADNRCQLCLIVVDSTGTGTFGAVNAIVLARLAES